MQQFGQMNKPVKGERKMWVYRALDEDGFPVCEAYRKSDLIDRMIDEFGVERLNEFTIIRVFEKWLK